MEVPESAKNESPEKGNPGQRMRSILSSPDGKEGEAARYKKIPSAVLPPRPPKPPAQTPEKKRSFAIPVSGFLPRWEKISPAFWTVSSVISMSVNIVLLIILISLFGQVGGMQAIVTDGLLGGLHDNFVLMDRANITTTITVDTEIPIDFVLPISQSTNVVLTQAKTIRDTTVYLNGIPLTTTIVLPANTSLPVALNLEVPVKTTVPVTIQVPVNIPLNQTELHEPFVGLQSVIKPFYCLLKPNAVFVDPNDPNQTEELVCVEQGKITP